MPKTAAGRRWLGLAPSYFIIGVFMVIPMVIMGVFSFLAPNPYGGVEPQYARSSLSRKGRIVRKPTTRCSAARASMV